MDVYCSPLHSAELIGVRGSIAPYLYGTSPYNAVLLLAQRGEWRGYRVIALANPLTPPPASFIAGGRTRWRAPRKDMRVFGAAILS